MDFYSTRGYKVDSNTLGVNDALSVDSVLSHAVAFLEESFLRVILTSTVFREIDFFITNGTDAPRYIT